MECLQAEEESIYGRSRRPRDTVETSNDLVFVKHSAKVGLMRIADIHESRRVGARSVHAWVNSNHKGRPLADSLGWPPSSIRCQSYPVSRSALATSSVRHQNFTEMGPFLSFDVG